LRELLATLPPEGLLLVDDSHGTGVLGARGRGSVELAGLDDPRIVITGTLSKALGCFGGFVAGSRAFVEGTRERSRAYVGSTPIPPAIARAASTALRLVDEEPGRRARLIELGQPLRELFAALGRRSLPIPYPVFTFKPANQSEARWMQDALLEGGLLVPLIHYPDGLGDYFRIALRADHTPEQVQSLHGTLGAKVLR
jgi:7-keto-8-aminopelargonate synthetase-like enzyme